MADSPIHGTASASVNPRSRDTFWPRSIYDDWLELIRQNQAPAAHESTHDKP